MAAYGEDEEAGIVWTIRECWRATNVLMTEESAVASGCSRELPKGGSELANQRNTLHHRLGVMAAEE